MDFVYSLKSDLSSGQKEKLSSLISDFSSKDSIPIDFFESYPFLKEYF